MFDLTLDWERKICDLCEKYEVDTDHYNNDDEFKETIAKSLGFSSFASFQAFPNARMIVGDMGTPIQKEHLLYVSALLDDCCKEIEKRWAFDRDEDVQLKQTDSLLRYIINNNLPIEFVVAGIANMIKNYDFPYDKTNSWSQIQNLYGNLI